MSLRIGIDVGGTNTDAVVVDDAGTVLAATKSATTVDPFDGIRESLSKVLAEVDRSQITQAMLGTTHPANAIIQRRDLERVGALRLAAAARSRPSRLRDRLLLRIGTTRSARRPSSLTFSGRVSRSPSAMSWVRWA